MNLLGAEEAVRAEQSTLGAVFLDQNILDDVVFLEPRDFSSSRHEQIYQVMRFLHDNNKAVDIVTVTEEYAKFGQIESMGGVSYLTQLAESCPTSANVVHHANIVRSKAIRRRGETAGEQIKQLSQSDHETDEEYFSAVESVVQELRPAVSGEMRSLKETRKEYFKHLQTKVESIKTGFREFDAWSNGLGRGDLHVLAGRPSVGKTAMLLARSIGVARNPGAGQVMIFSQEMGQKELVDRMISQTAGIPFNRIKQKNLSTNEWARAEEAYERLEELPIYIQDTPAITIDEIRAKARLFKRKHGRIAIIAVDYLQIMKIPQSKSENRSQAIGKVTTAAKQLAREMNCCFLMLSQMTRESEQKKKPQLSDLKESGSIEQDADVVEFLWFDPDDYEPGINGKIVQQFIAKGRNIGINQFRLEFRGHRQYFEEIPRQVSGREQNYRK